MKRGDAAQDCKDCFSLNPISKPLHKFQFKILYNSDLWFWTKQCGGGLQMKSRPWEQSSRFQPTQLSFLGFDQLSSLDVFQLCPVGRFERNRFVFLAKQSQLKGQWLMLAVCIKFQIFSCLVCNDLHHHQTICSKFWFMHCRAAINADAIINGGLHILAKALADNNWRITNLSAIACIILCSRFLNISSFFFLSEGGCRFL